MADYNASGFQYRPGISQDSAQMRRHGGMISAQQTQDDNEAMEMQKQALIAMLFGKGPMQNIGTMSPWFPSDSRELETSPHPANAWAGNIR